MKKLFISLLACTAFGLTYANINTQPTQPIQNAQAQANSEFIILKPGQKQITIALKSNPTTGYMWFIKNYNHQDLIFKGYSYKQNPAPKGMVGVGGKAYFSFMPTQSFLKGQQLTQVSLINQQPWENGSSGGVYTATIASTPQIVSHKNVTAIESKKTSDHQIHSKHKAHWLSI